MSLSRMELRRAADPLQMRLLPSSSRSGTGAATGAATGNGNGDGDLDVSSTVNGHADEFVTQIDLDADTDAHTHTQTDSKLEEDDGEDGLETQLDEEEEELLATRRDAEMQLIARHDSQTIDPKNQCWFLMDTRWLDAWTRFVRGEAPPPGRISTRELLDEKLQPITGLEATIDYRGVNPLVYHVFKELYGVDDSPVLMRYTVDIYAPDVPGKYKQVHNCIRTYAQLTLPHFEPNATLSWHVCTTQDICYGAMHKAHIQSIQIRQLWEKWDRESNEEPEELCCGMTREHIEAILFWFVTCCNRGGKPKYLSYKPLKDDDDDVQDENVDEEKKEES